MARAKRYWLMKTEPSVYSIDDLEREGVSGWEGVRNYQARNLMRDEMRKGDLALFYHSNAKPTGVAGVCRIVREAYPDAHAWDRRSPYFDPRSAPEKPTWLMVDVAFVEKFPEVVSRDALRALPALADIMVLRRGMRLSIQPVEQAHFKSVCDLGRAGP